MTHDVVTVLHEGFLTKQLFDLNEKNLETSTLDNSPQYPHIVKGFVRMVK